MYRQEFARHSAKSNFRNLVTILTVAAVVATGNSVHDHNLPDEFVNLMWGFRISLIALSLVFLAVFRWNRELGERHNLPLTVLCFGYISSVLAIVSVNMGSLASATFVNNAFILSVVPVFYLHRRWRLLAVQLATSGPFLALLAVQNDPDLWTFNVNLVPMALLIFVTQSGRYRIALREYIASQEVIATKEKLSNALEELSQLTARKEKYFTSMTHELRTPLTMILAPVEAMLERDDIDDVAYRNLGAIRRNALSLLRVINDLLDISKAEEGFLDLEYRKVNLATVLKKLGEDVEPLAARKDIGVRVDIPKAVDATVGADAQKIDKVLLNLVANALKFTSPGGHIEAGISTESTDAEVLMWVRDNGVGIAPQKLEHIFERFGQAEDSTTSRYGGSGLGLAFAKQIVELHEGQIWAESELGKGTTFWVKLPRALNAIQEEEAHETPRLDGTTEWTVQQTKSDSYRLLDVESATERRRAKRTHNIKEAKILVVEDSLEILQFVHDQLDEHYDVFLAQDGEQGLALAQSKGIDLVLTDFNMPKMDGLQLIEALKADEATASLPIIMLSAKGQLDFRIEAGAKGADAYLAKPFSVKELKMTIRKLLERQGHQLKSVLDAQSRSLEVISGGLAHEINNPLNFIRNANGVIEAAVGKLLAAVELDDPAALQAEVQKQAQLLEKMKPISAKGIARIQEIVEMIRRFAREGYTKDQEPIVVDTMLREVRDIVQTGVSQGGGPSLELELQAEGARVAGMSFELQQAFRNLVQNAVDAMKEQEGGWVKIASVCDAESITVTVEDNGPGMAADVAAKIFTPFFSTKGPGGGMGLGLPLTRQIVEKHGGKLDMNTEEGVGTRFVMRLPRVLNSASQAAA